MRARICVLAAMCWLVPDILAQDNSGGDVGSRVQALESAWNMAEEKGDARAMNMIFDDSLIYVDEDGSLLTKTQFLDRVKARGPQVQSLVTKTIGVHVYGDTAVIAGTYRVKGVERGKVYQRSGRFMDTWVLRKGAWACVIAQSTPILR
jgi:ketosteroid isomerase-like protein